MSERGRVHYMKLFLGTVVAVFLIFFNWKASYAHYCLSLIFPLLVLLIISYGYIELKMEERTCFKNCYLKGNSFFARLLSGRFFVTLFYLLASFAMTVTIFTSAIDYPDLLWFYLLLHTLLSLFLFVYLDRVFGKMLHRRYRSIFAREWTIHMMGVLLIAVFLYLSLNSYEPDYLSNSLQETILNASKSISSDCDLINRILKLGKTIDSSFWWVIHESTEQTSSSLIKAGIWIAFLLYNSLALLGINRLIIQIIYLLSKTFNKPTGR